MKTPVLRALTGALILTSVLAVVLATVFPAQQAAATETMLSKARSISLPTLQYRDVALKEILDDIQKKSVECDPEGIGVNIIVKLDATLLGKKFTMTINAPSVERALSLLAATAALYVQYESAATVVQKSERIAEEASR